MGTTRKDIEAAIEWAKETLAVLDTGSHMHLEGLAARRLVKCRGSVLEDIEAEAEAIEPD
jgi:hypothetical protein